MGGGGDVVGALATAEFMRLYDGAEPILGGLSWERRPIDPVPGPRRPTEIEHVEELAPGIMLAGPDTRLRGRDVYFSESRMAGFLGERTVLVDVHDGPAAIARGLGEAVARLDRDLVVFVDVGGDLLAQGDEPGLRSPLCDAVMLAAASRLASAGHTILLGVFGIGCDGELTQDEVLARLASVASEDGLCGVRGLTEPVAERLEAAIAMVPTEASAQAVRAFRGGSGRARIRATKEFELSSIAALTVYLAVEPTVRATGRLARAVAGESDLDAANEALHRLGVRTELDLEREAAGGSTST
jgi:hypothetical protein